MLNGFLTHGVGLASSITNISHCHFFPCREYAKHHLHKKTFDLGWALSFPNIGEILSMIPIGKKVMVRNIGDGRCQAYSMCKETINHFFGSALTPRFCAGKYVYGSIGSFTFPFLLRTWSLVPRISIKSNFWTTL